jgi:hypothetical protein
MQSEEGVAAAIGSRQYRYSVITTYIMGILPQKE